MAAPRPVPRAGLSLRHSRCRREGTALRSSSPASLLRLSSFAGSGACGGSPRWSPYQRLGSIEEGGGARERQVEEGLITREQVWFARVPPPPPPSPSLLVGGREGKAYVWEASQFAALPPEGDPAQDALAPSQRVPRSWRFLICLPCFFSRSSEMTCFISLSPALRGRRSLAPASALPSRRPPSSLHE